MDQLSYAQKSLFVAPPDPLSQSLPLNFQSLLLKIQSLRLKLQSLALKHHFGVLLKARYLQQFTPHIPKTWKCLQTRKSPFSSVVLPQFGFHNRFFNRKEWQTPDEIGLLCKNPWFHRGFYPFPFRTARPVPKPTARLNTSEGFENPTLQPFFC